MSDALTDAIGWISALILMATLARQVSIQWQDYNSRGVSAWLFVGQLAASLGFIWYSVLVGNTVFVVTNSLIACVALVGEWIYLRNRRS